MDPGHREETAAGEGTGLEGPEESEPAEEEKKKHQHNEILTIEEKDGDEIATNKTVGKIHELISVESKEQGKDEENKISGKEIPIMNVMCSKESSVLVHHLLEGPAKETLNEKNEDKVQLDTDDIDDFTQSTDISIEDYDLTSSNHNSIMVLIEKLNVDCKDPISLLKIEDIVLKYERTAKLKKGCFTLLRGTIKNLEMKIVKLQEELTETREMKLKLENQKDEWERELCNLRFALKQEEEKRLSAEMLFEKIRKQSRSKEEQYNKEMELKQQLELSLRTLNLELRTIKSYLKQVEEERNNIQRQLSRELSARTLQDRILNNNVWKQKERETFASKAIQGLEIPDSHGQELALLDKIYSLQEEITSLKLELEGVKFKNQEKENLCSKENEFLKAKNDEITKDLKLNEEALKKTIFQYSEKINDLTSEIATLKSKLETEKQNRDTLENKIESYHSRLTCAIRDQEQSEASKLDLEKIFQEERAQSHQLQDRLNCDLTSLRDNNGVLSQELYKAKNKVNSLENELSFVQNSLREKTLILESTQKELKQTQNRVKEFQDVAQMEKEKLNQYVVKQESIQERLAQIHCENMLLRQELEDAQHRGIIKEKVVSDDQEHLLNKVCADNEKQILMVEEINKELITECNHLREQMCKYENEKEEREGIMRKLQQEVNDSIKKQYMTDASLEIISHYRNDLEEKKKQLQEEVDQLKSKLQKSEEQHLQSQQSTNELEDHIQKFRKLLKTSKKKLRQYEKNDIYQGVLNQAHSEVDRRLNWLNNKIEDLTQHLEAATSKCSQLESANQSLQGQLINMKMLQKKCDEMEKNKRQLEGEIVNLKHHLQITNLERSQIEQYKREIEEQARQEIVEKLKQVNLVLQTQAASQENLEQLRENSNASIRNQMEYRIRDLESELSKIKNSHQDSTKAELERHRHLYSEELKIRKYLINKLDRTNEKLAQVSTRLLFEKQKNEKIQTLISSTASPVLYSPHAGNLNSGIVLNKSFFPRGNFVYSTGNPMSSKNKMEEFLIKLQQELEESIAKAVNVELESRSCRTSPLGSTEESSSLPNLKQDPVSRATEEYLEVLKKKYSI